MAGNPPTTLTTTATQLQAVSNSAGNTRPTAAPTPSNLQRSKQQRSVGFAPIPAPDLRKGAAPTRMDHLSGKAALDKQQFQRKKIDLAAIASALDKALASFDGLHQTTARHECRETVNQVLSFVRTHTFATTDGHVVALHRLESTHRKAPAPVREASFPPFTSRTEDGIDRAAEERDPTDQRRPRRGNTKPFKKRKPGCKASQRPPARSIVTITSSSRVPHRTTSERTYRSRGGSKRH